MKRQREENAFSSFASSAAEDSDSLMGSGDGEAAASPLMDAASLGGARKLARIAIAVPGSDGFPTIARAAAFTAPLQPAHISNSLPASSVFSASFLSSACPPRPSASLLLSLAEDAAFDALCGVLLPPCSPPTPHAAYPMHTWSIVTRLVTPAQGRVHAAVTVAVTDACTSYVFYSGVFALPLHDFTTLLPLLAGRERDARSGTRLRPLESSACARLAARLRNVHDFTLLRATDAARRLAASVSHATPLPSSPLHTQVSNASEPARVTRAWWPHVLPRVSDALELAHRRSDRMSEDVSMSGDDPALSLQPDCAPLPRAVSETTALAGSLHSLALGSPHVGDSASPLGGGYTVIPHRGESELVSPRMMESLAGQWNVAADAPAHGQGGGGAAGEGQLTGGGSPHMRLLSFFQSVRRDCTPAGPVSSSSDADALMRTDSL